MTDNRLQEIRDTHSRGYALTHDSVRYLLELIDRQRAEQQRLWDAGMPTPLEDALSWIDRMFGTCEELTEQNTDLRKENVSLRAALKAVEYINDIAAPPPPPARPHRPLAHGDGEDLTLP